MIKVYKKGDAIECVDVFVFTADKQLKDMALRATGWEYVKIISPEEWIRELYNIRNSQNISDIIGELGEKDSIHSGLKYIG